MQKQDSNNIEVTINKHTRVIHFSDGVEEEVLEENFTDLNSQNNYEKNIDPKNLSWGPWFSYYVWKSGNNVINTVDYVGESLANFFGITTPKYQIEINEYERVMAQKKELEEESAGWVPKNSDGVIPLVLNEPSKESKPVDV